MDVTWVLDEVYMEFVGFRLPLYGFYVDFRWVLYTCCGFLGV